MLAQITRQGIVASFFFLSIIFGLSQASAQKSVITENDILEMQQLLIDLNYRPLNPTGKWDDEIYWSTRYFAEDIGMKYEALTMDGTLELAREKMRAVKSARLVENERLNLHASSAPTQSLEDMVLSSDQKWFATGTDDDIKIYDFLSGREVRTITYSCCIGCCGSTLNFSQDNRYLVTNYDQSIRLWDLSLGQFTYSFPYVQKYDGESYARAKLIRFRPGSEELIIADGAGYINVYNWRTGKKSNTLGRNGAGSGDAANDHDVLSLDVSSDGLFAATIGKWDGELNIWDLKKRRLKKTLSLFEERESAGFSYNAHLFFSGDGSKIYALEFNSKKFKFYDIQSDQISVVDTDFIIHDLKYDERSDVLYLIARTGSEYQSPKKLFRYNSAKFKELTAFEEVINDSVSDLLVSEKHNRIGFYISKDIDELTFYEARFYDLNSAQPLTKQISKKVPVSFDKCPKQEIFPVLFGTSYTRAEGNSLSFFDIESGSYKNSISLGESGKRNKKDIYNTPKKVFCLPGKNQAAVVHQNATITKWNFADSKAESVINSPVRNIDQAEFEGAALSPDGSLLAFTWGDGLVNQYGKNEDPEQRAYIFTYDLTRNKLSKRFRLKRLTWGKTFPQSLGYRERIYLSRHSHGYMAFLPNNELIASREEWVFGKWDIKKGRLLKQYTTLMPLKNYFSMKVVRSYPKNRRLPAARSFSTVKEIFVSPLGDRIYAIVGDLFKYSLLVFDAGQNKPLKSFDLPITPPSTPSISPDGSSLFYGGGGFIYKVDTNSGEVTSRRLPDAGYATKTFITKDGKNLLIGTTSGALLIWNAETLSEIAQSYFFSDQEWVTITKDGFFHGSEKAAKQVYIRTGSLDVASIDQFYQVLYRPDLVRETLAGDPDGLVEEAAKKHQLAQILRGGKAPQVSLRREAKVTEQDDGQQIFLADIAATDGGIGRIEWRVNGITQAIDEAPEKSKGTVKIEKALWLEEGQNLIEVIAFNESNKLESPPEKITVDWKPITKTLEPKLNVLVIGINEYSDETLKLKFARNDALAIGRAFSSAGSKMYKDITVTKLIDDEVTSEKLASAFAEISTSLRPYDTFVLYLAGHGKTVQGRYYFIPQKFTLRGTESILENGIDQQQWQKWLASIPARKSILIYDTCDSGTLVKGNEQTRELERSAAIYRLNRATGRVVFSASMGLEPALEGYKGHGLFTYLFMQGFNLSDKNNDENIDLDEISRFLKSEVPKISEQEFGQRQIPEIRLIGTNFNFVKKADVLSEFNE